MAIEFTCPRCEHILRTGDEKAGLSAICPACGEKISVPDPNDVRDPSESPRALEQPESTDPKDAFGADDPATDVPEDSTSSPPAVPNIDDPPVIEEEESASAPTSLPQRRRSEPSEVSCPSCYAANDPGATHCRFCGESLAGIESAAPPEWVPPVPEVGETMSTAWRIYQDHLGLLVGALLLVQVVVAGLIVGAYLGIYAGFFGIIIGAGANGGGGASALVVIGIVVGVLIVMLVAVVVFALVQIGTARICLKVARGLPADLGDLFYAFGEGRRLLPVLLLVAPVYLFLQGFMMGLGMMFFWPFVLNHVDKPRPFGETFSSFFEMLGKQIGFIVLIGLIVWAINTAVALLIYPCCIGIAVTIFTRPFMSLFQAVGYLRATQQKTAYDSSPRID